MDLIRRGWGPSDVKSFHLHYVPMHSVICQCPGVVELCTTVFN